VKVIVTGSSGRVGRAVRAALGVHHEVLGVDVSPSSSTDVVASIEDRVVLERVLGGADAVVHAAGLHAPHVGRVPDSRFWEVNVTATRLLAGLCIQVGVPRLIFTSTTALYGRASTRADAASWVTEETPPSPRTIYHRTKLSAEAVLRDASRAGELDVVVIRMARCFPESAPVMAVFRMHRGVDVRDVAELHVAALVAPTRFSHLHRRGLHAVLADRRGGPARRRRCRHPSACSSRRRGLRRKGLGAASKHRSGVHR